MIVSSVFSDKVMSGVGRHPLCIAAVLILYSFYVPVTGWAEYIEPGLVKIKTEKYTPEATNFAEGTYRYDISWQGIPVADAEIEVRTKDRAGEQPFFNVTAEAETARVIRMFYTMQHKSNSVFDASSLKPLRFESVDVENRKEKKREVVFHSDGNIEATYSKNGKVSSETAFRSKNYTLDPISAAFVARSLPIDVGTSASFDVFNGKHRYLITCTVEGREKIEVAGRTFDAFRVVPEVEKLTDTDRDDRLKSATLWISADSARHVLKIESKVWVGSVTAELVGFRPVDPPTEEVVRASMGRDEEREEQ